MQRWSEKFLRSVSSSAVISMVEDIQPSCENFESKLNKLKEHVVLSTAVSRDDYSEISWDDVVDKKTEEKFLNKIRQFLDMMAMTPMGKDILSGLYANTYFGVAPIEPQGLFFDRSIPMIFLRSSNDIFQNNKLFFKILIHECTHAKNVVVGEKGNACILPPKLMFIQYMLNELSAYLSEYIVLSQRKDETFTAARQTQSQVFDCLDRLYDGGYIQDFSGRVMRWNRGGILQPENKTFSTKHLAIFAYYFKKYPALCDLALITKLNQLYHNHVIRPVRKNKIVLSQQNTR